MKITFAGTPPFAAAALRALRENGHDIVLVLTQPDRPAGRGMKLTPSAVALAAAELGVRTEKPATLKTPEAGSLVRDAGAEVMVVAAYGLILPQTILDIPSRGCLNIHGSLLPRWRGAAPVQRAIEAGDSTTGICIMQMDAGLDTGPVLLRREIGIDARETSATLFEKLTAAGAEAIVAALADIDVLVPRAQAAEGVTYAQKITRAEASIDWAQPAIAIDRRIRAFDPFPVAECPIDNVTVKIRCAEPAAGDCGGQAPGTVLRLGPDGIVVQCGTGALRILALQRPGGRTMNAAEFLHGSPLREGAMLALENPGREPI